MILCCKDYVYHAFSSVPVGCGSIWTKHRRPHQAKNAVARQDYPSSPTVGINDKKLPGLGLENCLFAEDVKAQYPVKSSCFSEFVAVDEMRGYVKMKP